MITVVIPSNREDCVRRFLDEWDFGDSEIIVVEDGPECTFDISGVTHVCWADIDRDLGKVSWIVPRRTSAVRSYGTWLAVQHGADIIWHLDDDCYPEPDTDYVARLESMFRVQHDDGRWFNTISDTGFYPRGFPYGIRGDVWPTMVHHGLWSNVPDFDGLTQLEHPDFRLGRAWGWERVPYGQLFPMCGMNLAFKRAAAPLMFMGLQGGDYPFDRFDDMWCGLFMKLTADHLGWAVTSGAPSVCHSRASDAARNATVEAPGMQAHEELWKAVLGVSLAGCGSPGDCYRRFAEMVCQWRGNDPYWSRLGAAMHRWADLFEVT